MCAPIYKTSRHAINFKTPTGAHVRNADVIFLECNNIGGVPMWYIFLFFLFKKTRQTCAKRKYVFYVSDRYKASAVRNDVMMCRLMLAGNYEGSRYVESVLFSLYLCRCTQRSYDRVRKTVLSEIQLKRDKCTHWKLY